MDYIKEQKLSIILIFLNTLFLIKVFEKCYVINGMQYAFIIILLLIGTVIYWFYEEVLKKLLFKILFTFLISGTVLIMYFTKVKLIKDFIDNQIFDNLNSICNAILYGDKTYFLQYKPFFSIMLPILVAIVIFISSKGWENSLLFMSYTIMLALWFTGFQNVLKSFLIIYVFLSIITFAINAYLKNKKKLNKRGIRVTIDNKLIIYYAITFGLVFSLVISLSPQSIKGKSSFSLETKLQNAFSPGEGDNGDEAEKNTGEQYIYDIAYSGYDNGTHKLGGPIDLNYDEVFKVKSDKPYYLRGVVKDTYDGFNWSISSQSEKTKYDKTKDNFYNDSLASTYFGTKNSLTIYPTGIKTSTFFAPINTYKVEPEKGSVYYDDTPTFMSNNFIDKSYTVRFYNIIPNPDVLSSDDSVTQVLDGQQISESELNNTYANYLQIPNNVRNEFSELVYNITKDCKTNYEKVQKIKDYLSNNYTYSLDVSDVPKGKEFIDYFLNVEKKGYCTYFATTTTIFCRIAGIPARYVEGYHMTEKKDSNGLYVVSNDNAHAWTEVLLLASNNRGMWCTVDCVPNAADLIQKERQQTSNGATNPGDQPVKKPNKKPSNIDTTVNTNSVGISKFSIVCAVAGVLIIMFIIMAHLIFMVRKHKFMKSVSAIPIYKYTLKRLSKFGIIKPKDNTDTEFLQQINNSEVKNALNEVVHICYGEFYGKKPSEEFDREKLYKVVEKYVRKRQNIFKYYFKKYYF